MADRGRAPRRGGFSLLETLVAFSILAMALLVLLRLFGGGVRNAEVAGDYARAAALAEARLATAGIVAPLVPGETSGEAPGDLRWTMVVERPAAGEDGFSLPAESGLALYHVAVDVHWQRGPRERRLRIATLRLGALP